MGRTHKRRSRRQRGKRVASQERQKKTRGKRTHTRRQQKISCINTMDKLLYNMAYCATAPSRTEARCPRDGTSRTTSRTDSRCPMCAVHRHARQTLTQGEGGAYGPLPSPPPTGIRAPRPAVAPRARARPLAAVRARAAVWAREAAWAHRALGWRMTEPHAERAQPPVESSPSPSSPASLTSSGSWASSRA